MRTLGGAVKHVDAPNVKRVASVPLSKPNRPREGSGPHKPQGRAPTRHEAEDIARTTKGVPQRKLTDKELPKAVGSGAWSAAVEPTVAGLRDGSIDDTDTHYRVHAGGPYTPERIQLHARIARLLMQGAGAHPQDKKAFFQAGGPASGKSTLLKRGQVKPPADAVDVNPDIVKAMLPEYQALVAAGDPRASSKAHEESAHVANLVRKLAAARQHHVVIDGVGNSGPGKFAKKIREARAAGYTVELNYATIPTDEAMRRAEERAKNPKSDSYGRKVPEGYIRTAHPSVSARFVDDILPMEDITVVVWDMQGDKPKRIFEKYPNGTPNVPRKTRKLYDQFVAKANETNG